MQLTKKTRDDAGNAQRQIEVVSPKPKLMGFMALDPISDEKMAQVRGRCIELAKMAKVRRVELYSSKSVQDVEAYGDRANIEIILSSEKFDRTPIEETFAKISHEFGHINDNYILKRDVFMLYSALSSAILPLFLAVEAKMGIASLIIGAAYAFACRVAHACMSKKSEYIADAFATDAGYGQKLKESHSSETHLKTLLEAYKSKKIALGRFKIRIKYGQFADVWGEHEARPKNVLETALSTAYHALFLYCKFYKLSPG